MPVEARRTTSGERALDKKIDAAAWGILLVWIGVALVAHLGWGVGLLGVGVITLLAQAWRKSVGVVVERFSLVVGVLFAVVGIWNIFDVRVELVPLLFIAAGIALLLSVLRRPRASGRPPGTDVPAGM